MRLQNLCVLNASGAQDRPRARAISCVSNHKRYFAGDIVNTGVDRRLREFGSTPSSPA